VSGPQTAGRPASWRPGGVWGDSVRHSGDRRIGGHAALARPRAGRRSSAWALPEPGQLRLGRCRGRAGVQARRRVGGARQLCWARRVGQGRGPGGAARVEHGRRWRHRIVPGPRRMSGGLARSWCSGTVSGNAPAGLRATGGLLVMRRGVRSRYRARLHRDRIGDRGRLAGYRLRDRRRLRWDRIAYGSGLVRIWLPIAAGGRPARVRRWWRGSVGRALPAA